MAYSNNTMRSDVKVAGVVTGQHTDPEKIYIGIRSFSICNDSHPDRTNV